MSVPPVPRRDGLTLAERRTVTVGPLHPPPPPSLRTRTDEGGAAGAGDPGVTRDTQPVSATRPTARHCWVEDLPDSPGRWPGLLCEWRRSPTGQWQGRVLYVVTDAGAPVLVEAWLPADHLSPAR